MGDFNRSVWSFPCVTMCNFIMYHLEIGPLPDCTKKHNKITPNVRAPCVAKPDANQRRNFFRRPDTNPTQRKNTLLEVGMEYHLLLVVDPLTTETPD